MGRFFYVVQGAGAGFLFGTASIFVRFLYSMDAFSIAFFRVLIAGLLISSAGLIIRRRNLLQQMLRFFAVLPALGILLGLHFIFFISAIKTTAVVNATTLVNTTPAIALIVGWALGWIKPSSLNLFGLLLTIAGAVSMTAGEFSLNPQNVLGDFYAVLGALAWALYLVVGKRVREEAEIVVVMGPIYLWTALATGVTGLLSGGLTQPRPEELYPLTALAILPTVLGHSLQFSSLKGLHPYEASALALLEPVVATILAAVVLSEVVEPGFYLSAAVVIAGIYLVMR
ncbi:MAG: DMT family transporter [Candidatus Caldarchaeum sp.]